jgi:NADH-quinone oxidoreductase subunit J
MESFLFYFLAAITLLSALSVVAQKRVFYSALSLIVCLCALAGLYMLLHAQFIAAVQVIVYAGAIMVLFLFVIMLLDPFSAAMLRDKRKYLKYAAVVMGIITISVFYVFMKFYNTADTARLSGTTDLAFGTVRQVGRALFRQYLLPFEVTSVLILAGIIGAVVLAKRQS